MWPGQFTAQENAERPSEPLYRATQGSNFGWPYCFYDYQAKKMLLNPEYGGDGKTTGRCTEFTAPTVAFPAHWAPVALTFHSGKGFPAKYKGGVFIAFHGSWNRAPLPQAGYNVTFQAFNGAKPVGGFEVFASGFPAKETFANPNDAMYRPDGVAEGPDGSLFITDSEKGRVWRVMYTGK
jgi:glucose/arabinose dehydrogenase